MQSFRDFMESALYDPGNGYYPSRVPLADFYTAPELHPAFALALAAEATSRLDALTLAGAPGPYRVVEMGSGHGVLARELWRALRSCPAPWARELRLSLIERCEAPLQGSLEAFKEDARVSGHGRLQDVEPFRGVLLSNELVDAFPVHLLEKRGGRILEVYVDETPEGLRESLGKLSTSELASSAEALRGLPEGERRSVSLEAARWLRLVSEKLLAGAVITVDYGKRFAPGVPNAPRAFHRHSLGSGLLERPGRQDLTASVDFEALIAEGERLGLRPALYTSLSRFLIERGALDGLSAAPGDADSWRERGRLKALIHPEGMGEAFKVLVQERP